MAGRSSDSPRPEPSRRPRPAAAGRCSRRAARRDAARVARSRSLESGAARRWSRSAAASGRSTCSTSSARRWCGCACRSEPALGAAARCGRPAHVVRRARLRQGAARGSTHAERELGLRPRAEPLVDEAVAAAGGAPGGTLVEAEVALARDERGRRGRGGCAHRAADGDRGEPRGHGRGRRREFLHDFRVAVRRTRAVQRELATVRRRPS